MSESGITLATVGEFARRERPEYGRNAAGVIAVGFLLTYLLKARSRRGRLKQWVLVDYHHHK